MAMKKLIIASQWHAKQYQSDTGLSQLQGVGSGPVKSTSAGTVAFRLPGNISTRTASCGSGSTARYLTGFASFIDVTRQDASTPNTCSSGRAPTIWPTCGRRAGALSRRLLTTVGKSAGTRSLARKTSPLSAHLRIYSAFLPSVTASAKTLSVGSRPVSDGRTPRAALKNPGSGDALRGLT